MARAVAAKNLNTASCSHSAAAARGDSPSQTPAAAPHNMHSGCSCCQWQGPQGGVRIQRPQLAGLATGVARGPRTHLIGPLPALRALSALLCDPSRPHSAIDVDGPQHAAHVTAVLRLLLHGVAQRAAVRSAKDELELTHAAAMALGDLLSPWVHAPPLRESPLRLQGVSCMYCQ